MDQSPEQQAIPLSGIQEISQLADLWAGLAVRDVLEPDEDDLLKWNLGQQLYFVRRPT